ncbi:hypothetical protein [Aliiroseovarius zhejiangensis]|nr:hypothetical protein [Aliiroseovarius zhejiangensis]
MTLLIRCAITLSMLVIASPLFAIDWKTRPTDNRLDQTDLTRLITGQTLTFHDGALSVFHTDGRYAYTYGGGGTWFGHYRIEADGTACITFVTGMSRCDLYVLHENDLVLITQEGLRFPIRSITQISQ